MIFEGAMVTDIKTDPKSGVQAIEYEHRFASASASAPAVNDEGEDYQAAKATKKIDDATDVVICAGPWTGKLLPTSCIGGPRAHSVVYQMDVTPYAVFSEIQLPDGFVPEHRRQKGNGRKHKEFVDPEVYARPFGEVYACGQYFYLPTYIPK